MPKINSFIWILVHGCILTTENLRKRGIVGPSRYNLCSQEEEFISHVFVHWPYTKTKWSMVLGDLYTLTNWPFSQTFIPKMGTKLPRELQTQTRTKEIVDGNTKIHLLDNLVGHKQKKIFQDEKIIPRQSTTRAISVYDKYM
jgi:hypothetical protein